MRVIRGPCVDRPISSLCFLPVWSWFQSRCHIEIIAFDFFFLSPQSQTAMDMQEPAPSVEH